MAALNYFQIALSYWCSAAFCFFAYNANQFSNRYSNALYLYFPSMDTVDIRCGIYDTDQETRWLRLVKS